jgi:hypothetical protein
MENEKWVYFEEWDTNQSSDIDSVEFVNGYLANDFFEKWSKSNSITYEEFNHNAAAWKDKKVSLVAEPYDLNKDHKISADESARAMFIICDDNKDGKVRSLEFYGWEIYL